MRCIILLLLSTSAFGFEILAAKRLNSDVFHEFNQKVLINTYKSLGIEAKMVYLPETEINERIKSGNYDALASKISNEGVFNKAIEVGPPVFKHYKVYLYSYKDRKVPATKIRVGSIDGVLGYQKAVLKNRLKFKETIYAKGFDELFDLLKAGKVDAILLTKVEFTLQLNKIQQYYLVTNDKAIYETQICHYIHEKHKDLKPKVETSFKRLEKSNDLDFEPFLVNFFK